MSADCNDTSAAERPTATETCNERDDDCDGTTDEGVQTRYWRDADGDGFGSADVAAETVDACIRPDGFQPTKTDCNDARGGINPGVPEICDAGGEDENCDGVANPASLCTCTNGETRGCTQSGVCAGGTEACSGGAWEMCSIQPVAEV
ncbi:MAG: hypothetical protein GWN07_32980, partial [Actinobacteria bacterium]|nr:hypothetical protein [Actinomycetota bacterium]NIS35590.1 hypothetical protein [Actinomycetota bacterium]NIU70248.1 hypothetical protein [Actinomycetota bacterium]NIV58389.1 hypothetical protein [Actinomycetota bacterium]NIW32133.1 hypothetical protein [Actinomycetota bacterium]